MASFSVNNCASSWIMDQDASLMPDPPRSALKQQSSYGGPQPERLISPSLNANRDWEGVVRHERAGTAAVAPRNIDPGIRPPQHASSISFSSIYDSASGSVGSPSVAMLGPAEEAAKRSFGERIADPRAPPVRERAEHLLDHQSFLVWRRQEYQRRKEAEARGETCLSRRPYSEAFARTLPTGYQDPHAVPLDFDSRTRTLFGKRTQVVGTREEIAWLQPPVIPPPIGWNGYWDLCAGHEVILQVMALSGANPDNSPSLTAHFMYPELLSAIQRLQFGTYAILYQRNETPHERYFYIKSLPLSNRGQFCPFFCWSIHRHSQNATDAIPLCNVIWVTQGIDGSPVMQRYAIGGGYIYGPYTHDKRSECLTHGAMTVWIYDGSKLRTIDMLAPDPLVFTLWMKLLEDFAQLNAALDLTGNVRALQRDLETSRERGMLADRATNKKKSSFFKKGNPIVETD